MSTKSKFLRVVLPIVLAASVLTTGSPSASAVAPPDGYYSCDLTSQSQFYFPGSYRILSGRIMDSNCDSVILIADGVTSIGDFAFIGANRVTTLMIPNSVTSIGDFAFYGANRLTTLTISNSVTSIGDYAFYGASLLTTLTIPNSVTFIGSNAFYGFGGSEYSYCGTNLNQTALNNAGLSRKTKTCAVTTPVITNYSISSITPTTATLNSTSSVAGTAYLLTLSASASAPTANTVVSTGATQSVSQGANTVSLSSLTPSASYVAYLVVRHSSGGQSLVSATSFTTLGTGISPLFASASSYDGRFTVQIKDYDEAFTYSVTSSAGQASINATGLVTVTGLGIDQSVTVTVTTTRTGYASGSGSITGRSQVAPMLPSNKPVVTITDTAITCTIGSYSATPTSSAFSLFVDGNHVATNFSSTGDYLPSWLAPWASAATIQRTASLTSASWNIGLGGNGKKVSCWTLAYSNHATGLISSDQISLP